MKYLVNEFLPQVNLRGGTSTDTFAACVRVAEVRYNPKRFASTVALRGTGVVLYKERIDLQHGSHGALVVFVWQVVIKHQVRKEPE